MKILADTQSPSMQVTEGTPVLKLKVMCTPYMGFSLPYSSMTHQSLTSHRVSKDDIIPIIPWSVDLVIKHVAAGVTDISLAVIGLAQLLD